MTDNEFDPTSNLPSAVKSNGNFRLQNKRIHLTYPHQLNTELYIDWIVRTKGLSLDEYSVVNEESDGGHMHMHALLIFTNTVQTTDSRFFDVIFQNGVVSHPNIKLITSDKHKENIINYHTKQGIPYTKLNFSGNIVDRVWNYASDAEAVREICSNDLHQVGGVLATRGLRKPNYGEEPNMTWRPWQSELAVELANAPDNRTILWYWDKEGGAGKTTFANHYGKYKDAIVVNITNPYHLATIVDSHLKSGNKLATVIVNFTRQSEKKDLYGPLESLKDGMLTVQKYQSHSLFFTAPHVVVFANFIPDVTSCSLDRWKVRIIDNGGHYNLLELPGKDIKAWSNYLERFGYYMETTGHKCILKLFCDYMNTLKSEVENKFQVDGRVYSRPYTLADLTNVVIPTPGSAKNMKPNASESMLLVESTPLSKPTPINPMNFSRPIASPIVTLGVAYSNAMNIANTPIAHNPYDHNGLTYVNSLGKYVSGLKRPSSKEGEDKEYSDEYF